MLGNYFNRLLLANYFKVYLLLLVFNYFNILSSFLTSFHVISLAKHGLKVFQLTQVGVRCVLCCVSLSWLVSHQFVILIGLLNTNMWIWQIIISIFLTVSSWATPQFFHIPPWELLLLAITDLKHQLGSSVIPVCVYCVGCVLCKLSGLKSFIQNSYKYAKPLSFV